MALGRWTPSDESLAIEAFSVLIEGKKALRTYPRARLIACLSRDTVSALFLKHCLEWDDSPELIQFRRGLLFVVQARGASDVAREVDISRVTLYRMLGPSGNPRLLSLIPLLKHLGVRLWVVEEDFIARRTRLRRPKNEPQASPEADATARKRMMDYPAGRKGR